MTFRTQVGLALAVAAVLPLAVLGVGVRREMSTRLERQALGRVEALVAVLRSDLSAEGLSLRRRLRTLASGLAADNRFRLAARASDDGDRRWLLDWAGEAMRTGGLAALRVHDASGRVLSSGHFRNEFDRLDPASVSALATAPQKVALVRFPEPEGEVLALSSVDSLTLGDRRYYVVGGVEFDSARAAAMVPGDDLSVSLALGGAPAGRDAGAGSIELRLHDARPGGRTGSAALLIVPNREAVAAVTRSLDRWLAIAAALTLMLAGVLALVLASRVSRPLAELAEKTGRLDLNRLDVEFGSDRSDEIGALANLLDELAGRLRTGTARLRDAERRAATGDLARQINHDVKNGLAPIRHVLRHLATTARDHPDRLAAVFAERRETLESSVAYLEGLARNYARLAPEPNRGSADLGGLLREIARGAAADGVTVETRVPSGLPPVRGDTVALRRIAENLVRNAVEALEGRPGRVTLTAEPLPDGKEKRVRMSVADTGRGMTEEELSRAFVDFHTTKPEGTGLGLSVVRRLVGDLGGTLRVETRPGAGSTFIVEIPAA